MGIASYAGGLFRDILTVRELRDTQFAFHDINRGNLDRVVRLCRKDLAANRRLGLSRFFIRQQRLPVTFFDQGRWGERFHLIPLHILHRPAHCS